MSLRVTNRFDPVPERAQQKCRHDDTFKARRFDSCRYPPDWTLYSLALETGARRRS
jgi:hypothetical protein